MCVRDPAQDGALTVVIQDPPFVPASAPPELEVQMPPDQPAVEVRRFEPSPRRPLCLCARVVVVLVFVFAFSTRFRAGAWPWDHRRGRGDHVHVAAPSIGVWMHADLVVLCSVVLLLSPLQTVVYGAAPADVVVGVDSGAIVDTFLLRLQAADTPQAVATLLANLLTLTVLNPGRCHMCMGPAGRARSRHLAELPRVCLHLTLCPVVSVCARVQPAARHPSPTGGGSVLCARPTGPPMVTGGGGCVREGPPAAGRAEGHCHCGGVITRMVFQHVFSAGLRERGQQKPSSLHDHV